MDSRVVELEALYRRGQYVAVVQELERMQENSPWESALAAGKAYYYGAMAHYRLDHLMPAIALIAKALEEIHVTSDWSIIGRIRYQAGEVYRRAGHISEALHWTQLFLADADHYPEHEGFRGAAHYNLGLSFRQARDTSNSIANYEEAVRVLRETGKTSWMIRAMENLSWVLCEDGRFEKAAEYLSQIETALTAVDDSAESRELRLSYLLNQAYLSLRTGRVGVANDLCHEVVADGSGASIAHQALAMWIAAECAISMQKPENARTLLALASQYAMQSADARLMNCLSDTRRKLEGQTA
ncbi:MAG TPA: tetratricopeptide repeat protein [Symbiobacteriaceae bacterium]|jgi:tetratricopeptide (TPR) repeat protein